MISWQVLWFSDFVGFLQNLKTTRPQVRGHVSWTRWLKLMVWSWIRPHTILNNMNIIFFIHFFSLFEWLAVIIWIIQENSIKWNTLKKYRKSPRNVPHWNMEYQVLYEDCRKSLEVKNEKNMVCRVSKNNTRQISSLPSAKTAGTRQRVLIFFKKTLFAKCQAGWHSTKNLKKIKKKPLCRVPGQVALGKEF